MGDPKVKPKSKHMWCFPLSSFLLLYLVLHPHSNSAILSSFFSSLTQTVHSSQRGRKNYSRCGISKTPCSLWKSFLVAFRRDRSADRATPTSRWRVRELDAGCGMMMMMERCSHGRNGIFTILLFCYYKSSHALSPNTKRIYSAWSAKLSSTATQAERQSCCYKPRCRFPTVNWCIMGPSALLKQKPDAPEHKALARCCGREKNPTQLHWSQRNAMRCIIDA